MEYHTLTLVRCSSRYRLKHRTSTGVLALLAGNHTIVLPMKMLDCSDNLPIRHEYIAGERVKLICLDPPFCAGREGRRRKQKGLFAESPGTRGPSH